MGHQLGIFKGIFMGFFMLSSWNFSHGNPLELSHGLVKMA